MDTRKGVSELDSSSPAFGSQESCRNGFPPIPEHDLGTFPAELDLLFDSEPGNARLSQVQLQPAMQSNSGAADVTSDTDIPGVQRREEADQLADAPEATSSGKISVKRTEQNRKAQARFRQRRQDKVQTMEKTLEDATAKLSRVMIERDAYQNKAKLLQEEVDRQKTQLASSIAELKEMSASEPLVEPFWEMVTELKRGNPGLAYTREGVADMVEALLEWQSPDLGFVRREIVNHLAESLRQGGDKDCSIAGHWLKRLISAYNKMVQRCGELNPFAFRTFLSLHLPEQTGLSANPEFWRKVVEAGGLSIWQMKQLAAAHQQLLDKLQMLLERRDNAGLGVEFSPTRGQSHTLRLSTMEQAKQLMDHQEHILREEQASVLSFRTSIMLAMDAMQQAKLMIAAFPFALDTLAICSIISENQDQSAIGTEEREFLLNLASNSPFHALASNSMPSLPYNAAGYQS